MRHLILLHGAIGAKDQLEPIAKKLGTHFHVHLLNFSGHGGVRFTGETFSIPMFAGEVSDFMRKHEIQKAHFFGYSMGGYVAMYLAKHQPDLVQKVITLGTKYHWDETVAAKEIKMLDPQVIQNKVPAFAAQLESRHRPNQWTDILSKTSDMLIQLGVRNALTLEDYRHISNECLLLLGDKDKMVSVEETVAVSSALPNGSFRLLENTPHPIEAVNQDLLHRIMSDFLQPGSQ